MLCCRGKSETYPPKKEVLSMRSWFARHPVSFMALYTVFYLTTFHWLEVNITVPAIWPIVAPAAVMTTFITFKQFDIIYLLTQQRGYMTGASLNTVITYAHQNAFVSNNYGLSSAVSMLLFVVIIAFSLMTNRSLREE